MNLLTLNLHKKLEWNLEAAGEAGLTAFRDALRACEASSEGSEIAMAWDWSAVVDSGSDDGPSARTPVPLPSRVAASGPSAGEGLSLEPGKYLFVQARVPGGTEGGPALDAWLAASIEWFAREAWWTKAATAGPLVVRLVREDGKTAVQIIRKLG